MELHAPPSMMQAAFGFVRYENNAGFFRLLEASEIRIYVASQYLRLSGDVPKAATASFSRSEREVAPCLGTPRLNVTAASLNMIHSTTGLMGALSPGDHAEG
jgi:hypothetical protein